MSAQVVPESDLLRAFLLARVAEQSHSRQAVMWDLTDNSTFLHERILRLVMDQTAPLSDDARITFMKILNEEVNRQNESLFAGEVADIRKYLEYLRHMGADVGQLNGTLVDLETRLNSVMDRVKRAERAPILNVKDAIAAFGPVIKEFNRVKADLKDLRKAVDKKTWELLNIYCRKIDAEAADSLLKVLTQDL
jgi:hypothetical protein